MPCHGWRLSTAAIYESGFIIPESQDLGTDMGNTNHGRLLKLYDPPEAQSTTCPRTLWVSFSEQQMVELHLLFMKRYGSRNLVVQENILLKGKLDRYGIQRADSDRILKP